jgi:serine/threonine-protein kinase
LSGIGLSEQKTVISKRRGEADGPPGLGPLRTTEIGKALEGQRLGHFELLECIGGGGMGVVFRGVDTTLGRTVAVKVVSNDATEEETLRRFRNEAQSAARLDHPNIARVYYVGEDRGWNYIVFEYIDGTNIRDLVTERGPLPLEDAVSYTLQIAEALGHAAERDVVHRDIKPSNILVMAGGQAKLVDMGLARLHQVESNANDLTATGVTLGTFDYISPEQARDPRTADVRSDLYSLGCTFYFMLTGLAPFPEGTVLQKLLSHSSEPPRDPRDFRGDLPEEIANIVLRLMAKQPSQRVQHPHELVAALLLASERSGLTLSGVVPSVWVVPRHPWWDLCEATLPWLVPAALLLAVVVLVETLQRPAPITRADMQPKVTSSPKSSALRSVPPKPQGPSAAGDNARPSPPSPPPKPATGSSETGAASAQDANLSRSVPPTPASAGATSDRPSDGTSSPTVLPAYGAAPPTERREVPETSAAETSGRATPTGTDVPVVSPREQAAPSGIGAGGTSGYSHVLIVRPDAMHDDHSNIVESLEAALQRVATSPDVSVIELHFDESLERPRTVQLPLAGRELTVRAGEGYRPVMVFQPDSYGVGSERRMLNLIGGTVVFEGVHFRMLVPNDMSEGWSLFHLNHVNSVRLVNCTLTIRNPFLSGAAFFHVQGPREGGMVDPTALTSPQTPKISLERCVARGQAAFVQATEGLPFWLTWQQGFLATSDVLADAAGLISSAVDDVVRIHLANVTASMNRGLIRLEVRENGPRLPEMGLDSSNCVFVHPREVPLVDYQGVDDPQRATELFEMVGRDNFYDFTEVRWRLHSPRGEVREFRWEEQDEAWYREKRAERGLHWRQQVPAMPDISRCVPQEYLLDVNESRVAGFDLEQLPVVPEESSRSARTREPGLSRTR